MAKEDYFMEDDDDITFNLLNMNTVNRLKRDGKIEVPKKKVDVPKDKKWNEKQMTSKILQGILSGSSVDDMADAMKTVIGNNQASAIRNTRTMVTSAENHGRMDSYNNLASKGVIMKKEWISTPDDRTRPTHVAIDGEQQELNKPFSNGCMFPGDAKGPSEEVWMCRCAMGTHIVGFLRADGSVSKVNYEQDKTTHEKQMAEERKRRKGASANVQEKVSRWGRNKDGGLSEKEANDKLMLAGINEFEGDIFADIRHNDRNIDRVKVRNEDKEIELIVYNDKKEVYIDLIYVQNKGQGEGTRLLNEIKKQAEEQGYSSLTAFAAGDYTTMLKGQGYNGYYSLARFGFDGDIPASLKKEADDLFGAKTIQDLMKTDKSRKWWKENGTGFEATLILKKRKR